MMAAWRASQLLGLTVPFPYCPAPKLAPKASTFSSLLASSIADWNVPCLGSAPGL